MEANETKKIETGGQAFPAEGGHDSGLHPDPGMTLRDYFAAKAMQSLVEGMYREGGYSPDHPDSDFAPCEHVKGEALWYRQPSGHWCLQKFNAPLDGRTPHRRIRETTLIELASREAYQIADAMLKARNA